MTALTVGTAVGSQPTPDRSVSASTGNGSPAPAGSNAGPPYNYVTVLNGQFGTIPLKDKGMLTRTKHGYRFRTGQQASHLVVTLVDGGLSFVDTGTKTFKKLSPDCQRSNVAVGIAAVCQVPANITVRRPLLIEVWPRLGNDFTDTSSLPATFAVTVLADAGNDVTRVGAGPDFVNAAAGNDFVWGGAGNDWIRAGAGHDVVRGGEGSDYLVAQEGRDTVHGGDGDDRVDGGDQNDRLWGDAGADFLLCGTGRDSANVDASDRVFHDCESVKTR
jgi:Ca2+-binding RTX toxin-like protein